MKRWQKIEHEDADNEGGRRVTRSGAVWFDKGDVSTDVFLIDDKDALDAKSYSVNFAKLEKHLYEAQRAGKIGLVKVFWRDSLGRVRKLSMVEDFVLDPLKENK